MKSWQTTTAGAVTIIGAICTAIKAAVDNDPTTVPDWGLVIAAITAGIGLMFARDNNKSSEQVGAGK